jgi:hypothetical protein
VQPDRPASRERTRLAALGHEPTPAAQLLCVYRHKNVETVAHLTADARRAGADVHLWALDTTAQQLAGDTIGVGSGERLELLNRLLAAAPSKGPLIVCDDDVSFSRGDLRRLLQLAWAFGFDVAQPAHERRSHHAHRVTRVRPGALARLTRFVEVGPVVVIAERARPRMTPFPVEYGMGWGLDVAWSDLVDEGFRFGVVDDVRIVHHGPIGVAYPNEASERLLQAELDRRGLPHISALHQTLAVWEATGPRALLARLTRGRIG